MIAFELPPAAPEALPPSPPPPPPSDPEIDALRVEGLRNRFIDHQQEVLHDEPDGLFHQRGEAALTGAASAQARLQRMRDELLGEAANSRQRGLLDHALDLHLAHARERIDDHVQTQAKAWRRDLARERLDLLQRQAAHDYADPTLIAAYADAGGSAAVEGEVPPEAAQSTIWRRAMEQALEARNHGAATALHKQGQDRLTPDDLKALAPAIDLSTRLKAARDYAAQYSERSLELDHDTGHDAATQQNATDWGHDPDQHATNQHVLDVLFGRLKRAAEQANAEVANAVATWLDRLDASGEPQTERPPFDLWRRLSPDQQRAVDARLAQNARGVPPNVEPLPEKKVPRVAELGSLAGSSTLELRPPVSAKIAEGVARILPRVGALAGGAASTFLGVVPLLIVPTNSQRQTYGLGDGLRVHQAPGQRSATIERRVAKGLFGTSIGEKWERVPVEAEWGATPDGRRALLVDPDELERRLDPETARRVLEGAGIAMAKRPRDPRRPDDDRPPPGIGHNLGQTPEPDPNRGPQPPIVPVVPQDRTPTQAEEDAQREFEFRKLARKYHLEADREASRRLIENLDMPVREFIAKYRRAGIQREFPGELLDGTVRDVLASKNSTARKFLTQERFGK